MRYPFVILELYPPVIRRLVIPVIRRHVPLVIRRLDRRTYSVNKQQIHISMNTKQLYTAPEADLLVVRFEDNIMSPGDRQINGTQQGNVLNPILFGFDDWD